MKRSGNISYGETLIEDIRKNKVFAVVIASDTGETSKKKIIDKSIFYKVPYFVVSSKEEISKSIGLGNISSVGIKSIGGANKIIKMMKED
jgi:ribosomal protein L7Ae-like RNA K-turn-binding protein